MHTVINHLIPMNLTYITIFAQTVSCYNTKKLRKDIKYSKLQILL